MAASARDTRGRAIISSRDAAMEKIVREDERLRVASPTTSHTAPGRTPNSAVANATVKAAAIVALEKAKA
jgi:hypothetical protein